MSHTEQDWWLLLHGTKDRTKREGPHHNTDRKAQAVLELDAIYQLSQAFP